jgi:hypothetical protein
MEHKSELINFEEENRKSQERIKESLEIKIEGVNRR